MRKVNLLVAGNEAAECYLVYAGGSVPDNVNRWRGQMGLDPISAGEVANLPRRTLAGLGVEAVMVELEGAYKGMFDAESRPDFSFHGVIAEHGGTGLFIRMVGPEDVVKPEREKFLTFLDSLQTGGEPKGAAADSEASREPGIAWDVPEGWRAGPERQMRIVTLLAGDATECYLATAGGDLAGNANRWRRQMQQPALAASEIDALQEITVLGRKGRVLEISGSYAGMGGKSLDGAIMLGVIVPGPNVSLFVKMIGPAAEVRANRDRFFSFVKSLRMSR